MAKRRNNEAGINHLQLTIQEKNKEIHAYRVENEALRNVNMMLLETLDALTQEEGYWSETAVKNGTVWRLKNVLNQCRNSG